MQTNAEGAAGAGRVAHIWERGATRRAILEAARLVATRTGSIDFSLNMVAREAGYSTTTVFAYFTNKNDLLGAVIADDLAALARQMRAFYQAGPAVEEIAGDTSSVVAAEPVLEVENRVDAAVETPTAETATDSEQTAEADQAEAEEVHTAALEHPAQSKVDSAKELPHVDAWLERRLRVFEKALAEIETRLSAAQKDARAAVAQVDENTRIFGKRLDSAEKRLGDLSSDLTTRMAGTEKRVRDAQSELRTSLQNTSMRLDQLEAAAQRMAAQSGYAPPAEIAPVLEEPAQEGPALESAEEKPLIAAADTYLSAARRAAKTAAALAELEQEETKFKLPPWMKRTHMMIAGAVALMFVVGPMTAYAVGEKIGRTLPVRIVVSRAAMTHTMPKAAPLKTAALTPLDKLSQLAAVGNPRAELLIGLRYLKGDGSAPNKSEAAKWILKSAAAHDPMGQYWAAEIYMHGDGVAADPAQAARWYEAAAGQGNRQAMHDLGIAYAEGKSVPRDFAQSAIWFVKAANLGLVNSQFNLAVLYERGEGVKQSLADAYKWYAIAAAQGDSESQSRVDAIATQLDPAALASAKSAVAAFKPQQPDADANTTTLPGA